MAKRKKMISTTDFSNYLLSNEAENSKNPLLYPFFISIFGNNFKTQSDAKNADGYVAGQLILEAKTSYNDWLKGFYQAHHYKKNGLSFPVVMVVAHKFVGIWKCDQLPDFVIKRTETSDHTKSPNEIGEINAKSTSLEEKIQIEKSAIYWLCPNDFKGDFFKGEGKSILHEIFNIVDILTNLNQSRIQIHPRNFINHIEQMREFFNKPIDAVHAFYSMVTHWDITSIISKGNYGEIRLIGFGGTKNSDEINIIPAKKDDFIKFVNSRYIYTHVTDGITIDYYFSLFDKVIAKIDKEYVNQHGIFFTDMNLSRFAICFSQQYLDGEYIWFDPAGGSGNLIYSRHGDIKHKIISELQPDLLKIIERRMNIDPYHLKSGFTIIPKTKDGVGLNFLDCGASDYMNKVENGLGEKYISIDKPIVFLLNPPYKSTDENVETRKNAKSDYEIHPSIIEIAGNDASKERYLSFLAQILNISKEQDLPPVVMIFTPTSWLIPKETYKPFREIWDKHFEYIDGFLVNSKEFFGVDGKWPVSFTIWKYEKNETRVNQVTVYDCTCLKKEELNINWDLDDTNISKITSDIFLKYQKISLNNTKTAIREFLPSLKDKNGVMKKQIRFDFSVAKKEEEYKKIVSGFPLKDKNHIELKRKCGNHNGDYIGFMDDLTPVRIKQDTLYRMSNKPDRIWFRLDNDFKGMNKTKCFNGATDNRSYCAYDLGSAQKTFTWFAITKALNGKYPSSFNQSDLWQPNISNNLEDYWYALCFAFVLSENRCIVTIFEKDNPVIGSPEIFVDNPMSPINKDSFWSKILDSEVKINHGIAYNLVNQIKNLYEYWNVKYCKGQYIYDNGLKQEAYFRYFNYPDFLTKDSGLVQIRKYAEINKKVDLVLMIENIKKTTSEVKNEIYRLLTKDFNYFS